MATFPSITPSYSSFSKRTNPNIRTVRFIDGYEHRIFFGLAIHQNPKEYTLQFDVSETEADVLTAFLNSRVNDQASFDFTPPSEGFTKTGTYVQSNSTTITITITNHGLAVNDVVTIDFTSGSAVDGVFVVVTQPTVNTFTVTAAASATNSGNVSITLSGERKFVCQQWNKTIPSNNRAKINTTFREVFEPWVQV